EYAEPGEYEGPGGFDPGTNEWVEGYEAQREGGEAQYAAAYERWTSHKAQVLEAIRADEESANAPAAEPQATSPAGQPAAASSHQSSSTDERTLASDEALAALRANLTGN